MSGSTIGGVVGAVVGAFFGNPQLGWMIGSAIGGYVDPEQIEGPKLRDARTQTSRDGVAIPFGWGTFPLAGNIIWQQPDVTEHKNTERQGKGGPEVTTYTYTRSYAIGMCEGPITGLLQVKRNGKIVYDARDEATLAAEWEGASGEMWTDAISYARWRRAENAKFINKCEIYLGDEAQLPDPTIESYEGVGNVPAYRGLAYIVVTDDDVTDMQGAIPQYEFVVVTSGTATPYGSDGLAAGELSRFTNAAWPLPDSDGDYDYITTAADANGTFNTVTFGTLQEALDSFLYEYPAFGLPSYFIGYAKDGNLLLEGVAANNDVTDEYEIILLYSWANPGSFDSDFDLNASTTAEACSLYQYSETWTADMKGYVFKSIVDNSADETNYSQYRLCSTPEPDRLIVGFEPAQITVRRKRIAPSVGNGLTAMPDAPGFFVGEDGQITQGSTYTEVFGTYHVLSTPSFDPLLQYEWYENGPAVAQGDANYDNSAYWTAAYNAAVTAGDLPGGWVYGSQYPATVSSVFQSTPASGEEISPSSVALSTIVGGLCERDGLTSDEYDASQLTDLVPGFRVANEGSAESAIAALMPSFFFDAGEWDGKVRFIKRGGSASFAINGDDLVERDGDAFERERVQEAELLRRVTVGYIDPEAAYGPTTQKWERRAGTVQAKGEASSELPLTLTADTAATIAKKRGLTAWGEPEKQKFSLPYRLAALTPTDIGTYTDDDGEIHAIRLMQSEDDSGIRYMESSTNSAEAYGATATGVSPRPPTLGGGSLIGPTNLAIMDLPLWRSTDPDELGIYVAASGYLGGWYGTQIDVSTDSGTSYTRAAQITVPATIGYATSALLAESSAEYPSVQSLTVYLPDAPESVSYDALLRYNNRAALQLDSGAWEILQYQTVTSNGGNSYTLSGLLRGRYNTTPGAAASGAKFVLLDAAVSFVAVERQMVGTTFTVRATSFGTSTDSAEPITYAFSLAASQTEWPVHDVEAERDASNNVTVTWVGRGRLGTETAAYHSSHMSGYRVTYSDGETYDVASTVSTHTRSSAPVSQVVTVSALNDITGAGPASSGISI